MKADNQKVLDKIRKLMAMAEREAGNEAEAATAAKMAEALLRKHNLSHSDISLEEAISDIKQVTVKQWKWTAGKSPVWVNILSVSLSNLYDTHVMFTKSVTGNDDHVAKRQSNLTFVGSELDATITAEMFTYLYKTINRLTDEFWSGCEQQHMKPRTVKNSFRLGAATCIAARIKKMLEEKKAAYVSSGTGLMVVKKDAIGKYLGYEPEYAEMNRETTTEDDAFARGYRKGEDISLTNQITDETEQQERLS